MHLLVWVRVSYCEGGRGDKAAFFLFRGHFQTLSACPMYGKQYTDKPHDAV